MSTAKNSNSNKERSKSPLADLILRYVFTADAPTFQDFLSTHLADIAELSKNKSNYRRIWLGCYSTVTRSLEEVCVYGEPNWEALDEAILNLKLATKTHSTSTSPFLIQMTATYYAMDKAMKWKLPSGTVVEDRMYEFGTMLDYEHAAHSFILDIDDICWSDIFNDDDLTYLKTHNVPVLPTSLGETTEAYISSFTSSMNSYNSIMKHLASHCTFDIAEKYEVTWLRNTISNDMMNHVGNWALSNLSENDLIMRQWSSIITSMYDTEIAVGTGEKESTATSKGKNANRTLNTRKLHGTRVDMRFKYEEYEIGCAEVGKDDNGENGTKEMMESRLKLPKTLRDMLANLSISFPSKISSLKTFGYVMMGNSISVVIMDCPKRYVCRIVRSPRLTVSHDIKAYVTRTLPIVRLYLAVKQAMVDLVDELRQITHPSITLPPPTLMTIPFSIHSTASSSSATLSSASTSSSKRQRKSD